MESKNNVYTPTVFLICGKPGSGKSTMLKTFVQEMAKTRVARINLLTAGQVPDWDVLDVVAVDEDWSPAEVAKLELDAIAKSKLLLAVAQDRNDIGFTAEPAVLTIQGASSSGVFSYKGQDIAFP